MFKATDDTTLGGKGRGTTAIGLGRRTLLGLLALLTLALPVQAAAGDQVPLKGSETGTFQLLGPCETGGLALEVTGTGRATLVGQYSIRYRECFDPTTGSVAGGSFTVTAANGDTLFGIYRGQALPTGDSSVLYDDPGVITGGTGRFAGATGILNASGLADLATGEYRGTISGSVSGRASR